MLVGPIPSGVSLPLWVGQIDELEDKRGVHGERKHLKAYKGEPINRDGSSTHGQGR